MGKTILVVDDSLFLRENLKMLFKQEGYEVVGEAGDGEEAIQKTVQLNPSLITMDITMPGMNGIEAIKAIKARSPEIKIIVCSAMGDKFSLAEAIVAGADDFVVKPFQPERILEAVKNYLG